MTFPTAPEPDDATDASGISSRALEELARYQLGRNLTTRTGQSIRLWALVQPSLLGAGGRGTLRRDVQAIVPAAEAVSRHPRPTPVTSDYGKGVEDTGSAGSVENWLVPLRPLRLPADLFQHPPARQSSADRTPRTLDDAVMLHDLLVGAEMSQAVAALMVILTRPGIWGGFTATATVVCSDAREVYAAANQDGEILVEQQRGAAPPHLDSYAMALDDVASQEPGVPVAPFCQDLPTAVLRRALRRPGIEWGSADLEGGYLGQAVAVTWLHRMHVHARARGPLSGADALELRPPALLRALEVAQASPSVRQTADYGAIWDLLWRALEENEPLVPGMSAADAAWRDSGVLFHRLLMWAGTPVEVLDLLHGRLWFADPREMAVVEDALRRL